MEVPSLSSLKHACPYHLILTKRPFPQGGVLDYFRSPASERPSPCSSSHNEIAYDISGINRRFHDALFARCGNGRIVETVGQVHDQFRAIVVRSWRLMLTYLREAADLLREHIVGFEEQFVRVFGHRPPEEEIG